MAKVDISKIEGIDDIDKKILYMLYDDARTSYTDIANAVELTRPAVKNRINVMENKGIITGYRPLINSTPDESGIKFMLSISTEPQHFLQIADVISMMKVHRQVYSKTGLNNIVAFGFVASPKEFKDYEKLVYSKIINLQGIRDISLHQLITTFKDVDGGVDYDKDRFKPSEDSDEVIN